MYQISNNIYCQKDILDLEIPTKLLTNPYYDYPYLIIENFFSQKILKELCEMLKSNSDVEDAKIRKINDLNILDKKLDKSIRKTKIHKLPKRYLNIYEKKFIFHQKKIEEFFKLALTTSTKVQVLQYTEGCFYKAHSDDSNMIVKDDKLVGFLPVALQRKITTVLFLDDEYEGGELVFNYLYDKDGNVVQLKGRSGDMIVFLSNPVYTHEVKEVISGNRFTLVQWHDAIIN
ncbi:hypothetical protein CRU99_08895 [Malaciobacter mytili]|uniref:Fe2OG dioxygenase domain-containing protein n=1 Tax=Malaciobacter mytili LMG 24559 TaxID=1032238 RepID=A0AAX2AIC8_9BACT|nr:2OG-Fe(II) oxygenase [Malaciobacter mytili]AXH13762.1 2OG-Fe(II) oxygenase family protein [Malaciobacter mytili LMG 24559]RXI42628.1 hypothetical protein CRU99_08895 [Malaciobacter mytili]RXK16370.1 hypothetical protein CP985_04230 [Malaciobacter mytili LMG 24559]